MDSIYSSIQQPYCSMIIVVSAILCGVVIGFEREHMDKPAGIKTISLICLGSAVFTVVSILLSEGYPSDRARIAAQVVTGVGFLGAGAIIRDNGTVVGLTTGATIWVASAIGVMVGAGYVLYGVFVSLIIVVLLTVLRKLEQIWGK